LMDKLFKDSQKFRKLRKIKKIKKFKKCLTS
jgi:hypothetical protein